MTELAATLGIVYCALLDSERRYADTIEWSTLVRHAASVLTQQGIQVAVEKLDQAARDCGLVSPLGWRQTLVPVHDAFADYLAGYAHGRELVPLPETFRQSDELRVLFAAEIGGVKETLAQTAARDTPFLTVELAQYDNRRMRRDALEEVEHLLSLLQGSTAGVYLWDCGGGTVVALSAPELNSGWVDGNVARRAMLRTPAAVVEEASPLRIAVRLWRLSLVMRLANPILREDHAPRDISEVRRALADYLARVAGEVRTSVSDLAPPGHAEAILANMPPLGMQAAVQPLQQQPLGGPAWPVIYQFSDSIDTELQDVPSAGLGAWTSTTFEHLTRSGAKAEAVGRVRNAFERLTKQDWLAP